MKNSIHFFVIFLFFCFISNTLLAQAWIFQQSGTSYDLNSVDFVDSTKGNTVGNNGIIRRTFNGGANWFAQNSGTTSDLNSTVLINNDTGYIIGDNGAIRKTTNGGTNWFSQISGVSNDFNAVFFTNANTGTIVKNNNNNDRVIFRTTNGGVNWFTQNLGSVHSLRWIEYQNSNIGTIVGDEGDVFRTTNGGTNWTKLPTGLLIWFFSASFVNISTGWMVGENGAIYKTTTGGASVPEAPSNLVGFPISASKIFLAWFDNSMGEQGFKIERSDNTPNNFQLAGTVGPNTLNFIDSTNLVHGNTYYYRVYAYTPGGNSDYSNVVAILLTEIEPISGIIPEKYALYNNYPNPFNPSTKIKFDLPKRELVYITVYDIKGQEIGTIVQQELNAGSYEIEFTASNLTSGIYFYRIQTNSFIATKKMMLIK